MGSAGGCRGRSKCPPVSGSLIAAMCEAHLSVKEEELGIKHLLLL